MKNKQRGTVIVSALFAVLCLAQTASAFYAPNLQRWVNRDPIEEDGGVNLYAFVENAPVQFFDPDGRSVGDFFLIPVPVFYREKNIGLTCKIIVGCNVKVPFSRILGPPRDFKKFSKCMGVARDMFNQAMAESPVNIPLARRACKRAQKCFNDHW